MRIKGIQIDSAMLKFLLLKFEISKQILNIAMINHPKISHIVLIYNV